MSRIRRELVINYEGSSFGHFDDDHFDDDQDELGGEPLVMPVLNFESGHIESSMHRRPQRASSVFRQVGSHDEPLVMPTINYEQLSQSRSHTSNRKGNPTVRNSDDDGGYLLPTPSMF